MAWQEITGEYRCARTGAELAEVRVLRIQTKLHQWAIDDPGRRFDDLWNLVCDPAVLVVAWRRVRGIEGDGPLESIESDLMPSRPRKRVSLLSYETISKLGGSLRCRCGNG
jgi:hypothetical protein